MVPRKRTTEIKETKKGWLSKMGLLGFEALEAPIMAAAIANKPLLFSGEDGTCKTALSRVMTESFYYDQDAFRMVNCPTSTEETFVGHLNHKAYQMGKIEYLEQKGTIWGGKGALYDEVNRVPPQVSGLFFEAVDEGHVNGIPTGIELTFGAVNPPSVYLTEPLDKAFMRRWCWIEMPNLRDLVAINSTEQFMYDMAEARISPVNFSKKFSILRNYKLNEEQLVFCKIVTAELIGKLCLLEGIRLNGSHMVSINRLLQGLTTWYHFTKQDDMDAWMKAATILCMGMVGECSYLIDEALWQDRVNVESMIKSVLSGVLSKIEAVKSTQQLMSSLRKDDLSASGIDSLLRKVSPESWVSIRNKVEDKNRGKVWKRVNSIMAARAVSNSSLAVDDIKAIFKAVENYRSL